MMPIPRASVDTCFFLRYLTGTPPDQAEQAEKILQQAERGEIQLVGSCARSHGLTFILGVHKENDLARAMRDET